MVHGGITLNSPGHATANFPVKGGLLPAEFLVVDKAPHFLLSVSKICDKDFRFVFDKGGGQVLDQDGQVYATINRVGDLYHLHTQGPRQAARPLDLSVTEFCRPVEIFMSISAVPIQVWHQRFCHINVPLITWMHKHRVLHGLDVGSLRIYNDCDGCHRGKAVNDRTFKTWKFFEPPVIHAVPKKSLRVVQMDWCGPFRTRGIGGQYYFVLSLMWRTA